MVPQRVEGWQLTARMKAFGLYRSRKSTLSCTCMMSVKYSDICRVESLINFISSERIALCVCSEAALRTNPNM